MEKEKYNNCQAIKSQSDFRFVFFFVMIANFEFCEYIFFELVEFWKKREQSMISQSRQGYPPTLQLLSLTSLFLIKIKKKNQKRKIVEFIEHLISIYIFSAKIFDNFEVFLKQDDLKNI